MATYSDPALILPGAVGQTELDAASKKSVVNGVAALDGVGNVVAIGSGLLLVRDGSNDVAIFESTSNEQILAMRRNGAGDYLVRVFDGGAAHEVQNASMKDVANGIAALDAAGALLLPGSKMYYTRDGSDDVHIYERTSDEEAYAFHRVGADDYTFFVKESNVWKRMQTESMKDAANGIAGLDANILLSPALLPPCMEKYSNHLGVIDDFLTTAVFGTGTVTADATNHEIDIDVPDNDTRACLKSKSSYLTDTKPLILSFKLNNIVVGGESKGIIGIHDSISDTWPTDGSYFRIWYHVGDTETYLTPHCSSGGSRSDGSNFIPASGDIITIVATSSKVMFFQNGVLKDTIVSNIPSNAQPMAFTLYNSFSACSYSVDALSLEKYV